MTHLKACLRDLIFPGLDLHTRNRATLAKFWKAGSRDVLDAGSGNGYFSWLAYQSGARVIAKNIDSVQVLKCKEFFIGHKKADPSRLAFEHSSLYHLGSETREFDEIICFETLEHIKNDRFVIEQFFRILKPGGLLHLCCPCRLHPRHQAEVLDLEEKGGHVRQGYTREDYQSLLAPTGFEILEFHGLGSPVLYRADQILRKVRNRTRDILALPLFFLLLPACWLDRAEPKTPFSLYVLAQKPQNASK